DLVGIRGEEVRVVDQVDRHRRHSAAAPVPAVDPMLPGRQMVKGQLPAGAQWDPGAVVDLELVVPLAGHLPYRHALVARERRTGRHHRELRRVALRYRDTAAALAITISVPYRHRIGPGNAHLDARAFLALQQAAVQ